MSRTLSWKWSKLEKSYVGLHVDVIPGDTVVPASGDALTHSEHQPLSPGHVDTVQSLLPLRCV